MADITKCDGLGCDRKETCYRYTAPASTYQSMFVAPPVKEDGECSMYWPVKEKNDH